LWVFLDEDGVEPTNNRTERALRFAVLWRKRNSDSQSDKGNRWVVRILIIGVSVTSPLGKAYRF